MIKAILAALLGSAIIGAVVFQMWLDSTARFMGEDVTFNAAGAALMFPFVLAYTAIVGIPVGLAIYWLLNRAKLTTLWAYLAAGVGISLALVALRQPHGLESFVRQGGDGMSNAILAIGISAPLIFWLVRRPTYSDKSDRRAA